MFQNLKLKRKATSAIAEVAEVALLIALCPPLLLLYVIHRWGNLTKNLALVTAIPLIEKTSFANVNLITQIFR